MINNLTTSHDSNTWSSESDILKVIFHLPYRLGMISQVILEKSKYFGTLTAQNALFYVGII